AAERIGGAKVVATELGGPIDATAKASIGAAMLAKALDREHDTFEGVAPKDRISIERLAGDQGLSPEFAHHIKLWFLAILTAIPSCEMKRQALDMPEVDQFLAETARNSGVKVVGIETPEEQLDVFSRIRPELAATLLAVTARNKRLSDDVYATMLRL